MLPAGYRQRDQTKKSATGPFDRFALMDYLEKQAIEHQDRDDLVPFTGEKRGTVILSMIHTDITIDVGLICLYINAFIYVIQSVKTRLKSHNLRMRSGASKFHQSTYKTFSLFVVFR